jgi:hypothetical protein
MSVPGINPPTAGGPPPDWEGDWAALAPEAQTAAWQQHAIRQGLEMQRQQLASQRHATSTGSVAFWVVFVLIAIAIVIAFGLALS